MFLQLRTFKKCWQQNYLNHPKLLNLVRYTIFNDQNIKRYAYEIYRNIAIRLLCCPGTPPFRNLLHNCINVEQMHAVMTQLHDIIFRARVDMSSLDELHTVGNKEQKQSELNCMPILFV